MTDAHYGEWTDAHYGEWAYRGEARDYTGEAMPVERMGYAARRARSFGRLPRNGVQCGEFLDRADDQTFEFSWLQGQVDEIRRQGGWAWAGLSNPKMILYVVRWLAGFWFGFGTLFCIALWLGEVGPMTGTIMIVVVAPLGVYLLIRLLLRYNLVPDWNNVVFHRDSGLVEVPRGWFKKPVYLPFAEFDAHIIDDTMWSGFTLFRLLLAHRQSERMVISPGGGKMETATAALEWEELQQYMDVTKPLPEIPDLEGIRGDDPTTVAADAANARPSPLWPQMTLDGFLALKEAAREPARRYPWAVRRRMAYAEGWRPSLHGQLVAGEITYAQFVGELAAHGYWLGESDHQAGQQEPGDENAQAASATSQ